jgi:hypothetical protein
MRLERMKVTAGVLIKRLHWTQNPWAKAESYDASRLDMTERQRREQIELEELPPENLTYARFAFGSHVLPRPLPPTEEMKRRHAGRADICFGEDVTAEVLARRYEGVEAHYLIGQDFGVLVNVSIVLKAYRLLDGTICWWVIDEITTANHTGADVHAALILERYDANDVLVVADPHLNSPDVDKSDYERFREAGLKIVRSCDGFLKRKARIGVVQTLLFDPRSQLRRLFIDCTGDRRPKAEKLVWALLSSTNDEHGEPERGRKKGMADPSHWPSALGFALYPLERHALPGLNAPEEELRPRGREVVQRSSLDPAHARRMVYGI